MKHAIQIYALTVCFFTMGCLAITTGLALWNALQIAVPTLRLSKAEYTAHQSDEAYIEYLENKYSYKIDKGRYTLPKKEDVTKIRERSYRELASSARYESINSLVFQIIIILVDIGVYWLHWHLVKERENG